MTAPAPAEPSGPPGHPAYQAIDVLSTHRHTLPADVLRSLAGIWICASAAQWGQPYETWWLDLDDPDVAALYRDHDTAACDAESQSEPDPW